MELAQCRKLVKRVNCQLYGLAVVMQKYLTAKIRDLPNRINYSVPKLCVKASARITPKVVNRVDHAIYAAMYFLCLCV